MKRRRERSKGWEGEGNEDCRLQNAGDRIKQNDKRRDRGGKDEREEGKKDSLTDIIKSCSRKNNVEEISTNNKWTNN